MASIAKELILKEMTQEFEKNSYAFISSSEGLAVADISDFRRTIEKVAGRSLVVKHSIVKKVFSEKQLSSAERFLKGQVFVTFANKDPQIVSKTLVEFSKNNSKLVPSGVIFEGQVYDAEFVKQLAKLPSRHELLTQVAVRIKSPITGFVMTLHQLVRGFVVVLNEVKKKKEVQN